VPTNGYLFVQKEGLRHLDGEKADKLDIPFEWRQKLKQGIDYTDENGQLVISSEQITSPPSPPISYAYCSDTAYSPEISNWVKAANCLYHEATYLDELKSHAHSRFHSTAKEAAEIATAADVGQLLLGHHSSRYADTKPLVDEAKRLFSNTESVIEGNSYFIR
jgi:ribonuclease Z